VNNSMVSVHEVFGEQVFSGGFWLPWSPSSNLMASLCKGCWKKTECKQPVLFAGTNKKLLGMKFLLFPYSNFDVCLEKYSHDVRYA
jgi:hypothetical protein